MFVFDLFQGFHQVFAQKIRRPVGDFDGGFDERFRQRFLQVCLRRRDELWRLLLDRDDRAQAGFDRREVAFDVDVHLEDSGVGHGVLPVTVHVLELEDFVFDGRLQNAQVVMRLRAEQLCVECCELLIEACEPRQFRIQRRPAVVGQFAVVFVQAECRAGLRPPREVTGDRLFAQLVEFRFRRV